MKKIIIVSILLCLILAGCGQKEDISGKFEYFYADKSEIMVENNVEVVFTASILTEDKVDEIIVQTESGEVLGYLYNDGTGKDQIANDNIFTGSIEMTSDEEKHENIVAVAKNLKSQSIDFFFYNELTEEDFEQLNTINIEISEIQQKYMDNEGYIPEENIGELFDEVLEYVEKKKEIGIVTECLKENDCIYLELSNGIGYMFILNQKDILSSGNAKKIITIEPVRDSFGVSTSLGLTWIDKKYNNLEYQGGYDVTSNAKMIAENSNLYDYNIGVDMNLSSTEYMRAEDDHYVNEEVCIDNIKKLAGNGIIIWEGHGGYSEKIGSALITSESASILKNLKKYSADLKEKRLVTTGGWYTLGTDFLFCNYAVTSKFFEYYFLNDSLDGSLIYLGACNSGTDDRLANSLLNKGAKGVYASNGTIFIEYEMLMRTNIFYNLLKQTASGDFFTVKEALEAAWKTIGAYDFKNENTFITYYGDENYRLIQSEENINSENTDIQEQEIDYYEIEYDNIVNLYNTFVNEKAYEQYINDWSESASEYAILDINQDGIPELLINSELDIEWQNTVFFSYDIALGKIVYIDDIYHFADIRYSSRYKAIEYTDIRPNILSGISYFNVIKDKEFICVFTVGWDTTDLEANDMEIYNFVNEFGKEDKRIENEEREEYFSELKSIDFISLPNEEKIIAIDTEKVESSESIESLTEEDAYMKVEEYWRSLGYNMPEEVEYEGLTESGHCFWGYNIIGDHAVTHFRICVDANTGQITVEGGIYHEQ